MAFEQKGTLRYAVVLRLNRAFLMARLATPLFAGVNNEIPRCLLLCVVLGVSVVMQLGSPLVLLRATTPARAMAT